MMSRLFGNSIENSQSRCFVPEISVGKRNLNVSYSVIKEFVSICTHRPSGHTS